MKIPSLEIENFLAITEAKLSLADRGLVLVQGENQTDTSATSNGSGKSSIADALCWAAFGVTARGQSGDGVVNNIAKKGTRVSFVTHDPDEGADYTITRHRKHKTGKNTLTVTRNDGTTVTDLTKGTDKLTQEVVAKIIGCSYEVFAGSIYAGQEKMPDLPSMTDKNLKLIIEEAAGVTQLEEAYKISRQSVLSAKSAADSLTVKKSTLHVGRLSTQAAIDDMERAAADWENDRLLKIAAKQTEARGLITRVGDCDRLIKTVDVADAEAALASIDAAIASVAQEGVTLAQLTGEAARLFSGVGVAQHAVTASQNALLASAGALGRAQDNLARVESTIGCPCGSCGRPITPAEIAASRANLLAALRIAELGVTETQQKVALEDNNLLQAQSLYSDARTAAESYKAGMTDVSAQQAARPPHLQVIATANNLANERKALITLAQACKDAIDALNTQVNPHHSTRTAAEKRLAETDAAIAKVDLELKEANDTLAVEEAVAAVFGPAGVRARILDEVTPFLNTQTSKYLGTLSDGNIEATWSTLTPDSKGVLKEKFSIDVTNLVGSDEFIGLSGGEKRKVRLATALALQDLVATRASKPIDLFIGDEIDDALDPAGIERMTILLEEKARERGSVFIISHNDIKDNVRQVLTITKQASGQTIVTEVTA